MVLRYLALHCLLVPKYELEEQCPRHRHLGMSRIYEIVHLLVGCLQWAAVGPFQDQAVGQFSCFLLLEAVSLASLRHLRHRFRLSIYSNNKNLQFFLLLDEFLPLFMVQEV